MLCVLRCGSLCGSPYGLLRPEAAPPLSPGACKTRAGRLPADHSRYPTTG